MAREHAALVGRDAELAELERLLGEAFGGTARAVVLIGEPGIGKTSLLKALVAQAEARNGLVLEGSAAEFEQDLPFGVVIDALDAYVQSLGAPVFERLAADGLTELADVLPSLRRLRGSDRPVTAAGERFRIHYAARELLERLASRQPVVLVLDDLHWADGASRELVAHLLRHPPDAPVLLAGAFRPGQVDVTLARAVDQAVLSGAAARIEVGPLRPEDAAQLGADDRLYVQSGGNPFYLLELARLPAREGIDAPPAVAAAVAQELSGLSPPARALVEGAAVVGDPFDLDLAAAVAGGGELDSLAALDELVARSVLRPDSVPRRFAFRHPLVRSAVYRGAPVGVRLAAHARCATALAQRGAPAVAQALHVEQSAAQGDRAAVDVLLEAGRTSVQQLPTAAARWFRAALRLLPENAERAERIDVLMALAGALTTAGQLRESRTVLLEGLALEPQLSLTVACAGVEQQLGMHEEAHDRLVAALEGVEEPGSPLGVSLMVALAADAFHHTRYEELVRWGRAAVEAAEPLGDRRSTGSAEAALAMGCAITGLTDEAAFHADRAATAVDAMADAELSIALEAVGHLTNAELIIERFEAAAAHARRGISLARAAGRIDSFPTLFPCLGTACWVMGQLAESAVVLDHAVESARLTGNEQAAPWNLLSRAISALMAGDFELAVSAADEANRLAGGQPDSFVGAHAGVILGWVLAETGEPRKAVDLIVTAGGGPDLPRVTGGWKAGQYEVLTRAWLALGRPDEARLASERARAVADQVGLPRSDALAHLAAAAVALHHGDYSSAIDQARAAVARAEHAGAWYDAAVARVVVGRALALAGEAATAIAELQTAAAAFDRFGATRRRDQAEHELRKLGHRIHRRSQPGAGGGAVIGLSALSGRELEVAKLVVDRRTNSEIAAELFLSLKTVETHLRNIFRKLDVSSRVEVARTLERAR